MPFSLTFLKFSRFFIALLCICCLCNSHPANVAILKQLTPGPVYRITREARAYPLKCKRVPKFTFQTQLKKKTIQTRLNKMQTRLNKVFLIKPFFSLMEFVNHKRCFAVQISSIIVPYLSVAKLIVMYHYAFNKMLFRIYNICIVLK